MGWLWALVIGARVLAAALLLAGPWTDSETDLDGWDSQRFQEISDAPGRHWVDHEVEYPPGSVIIIEIIAGESTVATNRVLVATSLVVDLGLAWLLHRRFSHPAGLGYLVLGLPLVPAGLLRLDLWAALAAAVGLDALVRRRPARFAAAVVTGAAIKIFPALLIPAAVATGRTREAVWASLGGAIALAAWIAYAGLDGPSQVLSLRGVSGWHLESIPGSVIAVTSDEPPRLEANAYRIGELSDQLVLAGRAVLVGSVTGLTWLGHRNRVGVVDRAATVLLGSTAALVVTAPLLSPQFLLWLTPWAGILAVGRWRQRWSVVLTFAAAVVTGSTLVGFGPPNVDHPVAAALLLVRDGLLVGVVAACGIELWSGRSEDPRRSHGTGPRTAGSQPQIGQMAEEHQPLGQ